MGRSVAYQEKLLYFIQKYSIIWETNGVIMAQTIQEGWTWGDLNPLTRSLVAAFSGSIGSAPGQLDGQTFISTTTEAFSNTSSEDVVKGVGWFGLWGVRNGMVNQLQGFDREEVAAAVQAIAPLAGGTESVTALAEQIGHDIIGSRRYDVYPALQLLSELAVQRLKPSPIEAQ